jgi:hypothetical protein
MIACPMRPAAPTSAMRGLVIGFVLLVAVVAAAVSSGRTRKFCRL